MLRRAARASLVGLSGWLLLGCTRAPEPVVVVAIEEPRTSAAWMSEQWLSQAGTMIEVRSAHRTSDWYDFWDDDGSGTVEASELVERELWSLGTSVVVHEITIHSEERSFYPDDGGNGGEANEEFDTHDTLEVQWRVEPRSGEPVVRVRGSAG